MAYPVSSFEFYDLAWVIPFALESSGDIPTTIIFCKTIELGFRVMSFLDRLIPSLELVPNGFTNCQSA